MRGSIHKFIIPQKAHNRNLFRLCAFLFFRLFFHSPFPKSKVKDDSLDNRVLVKKVVNKEKNNNYPINKTIRRAMKPFWYTLYSKELISREKYDRLIRSTELSESELSDFINRQIVETSQSAKAVADILKILYPKTEVVYVKSRDVSDFRRDHNMIKCRIANDMHHAKDAYLNIVVGNVYNEKVTHNRKIFIRKLKKGTYSVNKMFDYPVKNAWITDNNYSISIVKNTMRKNNVLCRKYSLIKQGSLFNLPLKKGNGQVPLKKNSPRSDISKYGGYSKPGAIYFSYVETDESKNNKKIRQFVPIENYLRIEYEENPIQYLTERLGLVNPKILIPIVKYNACIEIDGFRMYIRGKSVSKVQTQILYCPATQLVIGYDKELYAKNIVKLLNKSSDYVIKDVDGISKENNISLFDCLIDKMCNTVFKVRFEKLGKKILSKRDIFLSLELRTQCFVLNEILKILHSNDLTGKLEDIGIKGSVGAIKISPIISNYKNEKSIYLVNQSVTGLFENKIDLLNM